MAMEGACIGGMDNMGAPPPPMVVETCHVSEEACFEHCLPAHGNPCRAASKPL
jgi:hypothetical protein